MSAPPTPIIAPPALTQPWLDALAVVMAERTRAVAQFGHSDADDFAIDLDFTDHCRALDRLARKGSTYLAIAADRAAGRPDRRHLPGALKKAAQAAALTISFIAAIQTEMAREAQQEEDNDAHES